MIHWFIFTHAALSDMLIKMLIMSTVKRYFLNLNWSSIRPLLESIWYVSFWSSNRSRRFSTPSIIDKDLKLEMESTSLPCAVCNNTSLAFSQLTGNVSDSGNYFMHLLWLWIKCSIKWYYLQSTCILFYCVLLPIIFANAEKSHVWCSAK